ncbi:hypothetical protein C7M84_019567 [Penaeus vannamei]|uniref:Uncharacterized protein n=1 Tax=Penaeus vannamei TaxID=6689 RepID=A0A423SEF6_PENVA|nr:hypothetical protein C7M84_019567 [Penaeus vannamei]
MVNREEESEDFHLPTPPEMSSAESSTEECIQTPERGETPVTGPWRVAEEAPPPPEDVNNLTWEHFPVIEDSPEEPQTPEEEVQEPSILSIGPHEITYKRKTTQDAEDTDTHSPLMKEVNACQHLIERVIGAIERMENIVARQDEQLTARSQGGQQLPQQSGTSQPHRSSWQGFQDHASQERRRKKRKPRKKQRKQQTQEDIRVQENAPQQREATSQPQRRKVQDTGNDGGTEAGPEEEHLEPTPTLPTKECQGKQGKRYPTNTPSGLPEKTLPPPRFPKERVVPQPSEEHIQVAGTEEPPQGKKTQHGKQIQWLGRPSKRKLPVGNRKKRRKTVARRRSKQLGMELVEEAAYVVANFYEQNFSYVEERLFSDFNMAAPPPYLIKEGIDHVLGGTLLRFNNRFFRQGKGTAIGASVSVAALRIKRIVSEEHKLETALQEMTGFFKARGYDNRCLNSALERVGNLQRDQLLIRKGHTLGNSLQDPPTNDSMEERKIDCREADQSAVPVASGRAQGVNEWQTTRLRYLKENRGGPRLPQSSKPAFPQLSSAKLGETGEEPSPFPKPGSFANGSKEFIGRSSEAVPERNMGMDQRKFQGHTLGNSLQDPPTNDSMEERKIDCREADQSAVPVASGRAQGVNEWQTTKLRYLKENRGGPRLPQSSKPAV